MSDFTIQQNIFKTTYPPITVRQVTANLASEVIHFLKSLDDEVKVVGLAASYGKKCCLSTMALSSAQEVLVVHLSRSNPMDRLKELLVNSGIQKYAFQMDKLSAALNHDFELDMTQGKDILSIATDERLSMASYFSSLGGKEKIHEQAVRHIFRSHKKDAQALALEAWAAYSSATDINLAKLHATVAPINTVSLEPKILRLVSKTIRNIDRSNALKPNSTRHEAEGKFNVKSRQVKATSERYKTRIMRPSENQYTNIVVRQANGERRNVRGHVINVKGRGSSVCLKEDISNLSIESIHTIGKDRATSAETAKDGYMLSALQKNIDLAANRFVQKIWFPPKETHQPLPEMAPIPIYTGHSRPLNASQTKALNAMLSRDEVVLVHGPPGTGKTTVIAACVTSLMASTDKNATLWLVAQSNVAVKNVAEKLAAVNFLDFKILVAHEFHFDWHEHLYQKIESNVIRSEQFDNRMAIVSRLLLGSKVILCTLSTLSNEKITGMASLVKLQTVIFDEASQIELGDYLPMLVRFQSTLKKLVFIGDNKQLAPYGTRDIETLGSVFEMKHLEKTAILLDTQYRMPVPLGVFISQRVYKNRLKSQHDIIDPLSCRFVDVDDGVELSKGFSWQNTREVDVIMSIARQLTDLNKSFRIITPYDAQRSALEAGLKVAKLQWEDKVFNIDAFQGNEDDYIVVSLVRTAKLGFLNDERRVNVMLTRCKKGMIICARKTFLEGVGRNTLVAKLAKSIGKKSWVQGRSVQFQGVRPFS